MTRPQVVALIGSPYQALGLLEYVRRFEVKSGLVFVTRMARAEQMRPTYRVLAHLDGFGFRFRRQGGFIRPGKNTAEVADELAGIARSFAPDARLLLGEYRDTLGWRLARNLDRSVDEVVVLDDGVATLAIDRSQGGVAPLEWSEAAESGGFMPLPAVTFFTAYSDALRPASDDVVLANDWSFLRSQYGNAKRSESLVLIVGQGFANGGIIDPDLDLALAKRLVHRATEIHPGARLLYVAHRAESPQKLSDISTLCSVVRFDVPLELLPIETGWLPMGIVGLNSTALASLAELAPTGLPIHAVRVVESDGFHARQEHIANIYTYFESRYPDSISVVD